MIAHLYASIQIHHDVSMRTTVTLDPDVDRRLKEEMRRSGITFRQAVNQAIRRALAGNVAAQRRPFKLRPKRLSLRPGLDPAMLQHLEEELEIESFLQKTRKLLKS
ncbi:MAG TPA: CopG family transcriptional regulator [Chthoniobacterales bacterium]|nr:CopG family transcriptional regulator [Chthoniobacterales bacterium]